MADKDIEYEEKLMVVKILKALNKVLQFEGLRASTWCTLSKPVEVH